MFTHFWSGLAGGASVPALISGCFVAETAKEALWGTAALSFLVANYLVWLREHNYVGAAEQKIKRLEAIVAAKGRLEISFREAERQFDELIYKTHLWPTRCLSVCIENVGAKALTNCQIYFDGISTPDGRLVKGIAMRGVLFSLNPTEKSFVLLVSCEEQRTTTPQNATLHVPPKPNQFGDFRLISTSEAHEITLRATAAECESCTRKFRVWLSEDAKLKMVRLD
jgi:hypothetical protein